MEKKSKRINAETDANNVQNSVSKLLYPAESYQIRGACFAVWRELGGAFKEAIIEKALVSELRSRGLEIDQQKRISVFYNDVKVGTYTPDLIIEDKILIELKAKPMITREDERQFWYYLKGTDYRLGFLINFASKKLEIRRRIYDQARLRKSA